MTWSDAAYGRMLTGAARSCAGRFAALASPTFSKQETVTHLADSIRDAAARGYAPPPFPWREAIEFLPRLAVMFARLTYAVLRFRTRRLPERPVYFRTWLVPRSFRHGRLTDDYFRQLPADLEATHNVVLSFTSLDIGLLRQFTRASKRGTCIISYGLLTVGDVLRLFVRYVFTGLVRVRCGCELQGVNVTPYVNRSLLLDYLMLRSFEAHLERYKCQRLAQHGIHAFVYVFENQSWEKICCAVLGQHGIRRIGYQSSGFSPVFLNFFPNDEDAARDPMPDMVLTVGDLFRRYLLQHGVYRVPVRTFAALRFDHPRENGTYTIAAPDRRFHGRILYALPVQLEQYRSVLADLVDVFAAASINVDVKPHPIYSAADIARLVELPASFRVVSDVDMDTLRATYDCVLFNDNSFGIEAVMRGVKCHQYSRSGASDDERLIYFDLWKARYSLADLRQLRDELTAGAYDKTFDTAAVARYINAMYRPYRSAELETFRALLNAPGHSTPYADAVLCGSHPNVQ